MYCTSGCNKMSDDDGISSVTHFWDCTGGCNKMADDGGISGSGVSHRGISGMTKEGVFCDLNIDPGVTRVTRVIVTMRAVFGISVQANENGDHEISRDFIINYGFIDFLRLFHN